MLQSFKLAPAKIDRSRYLPPMLATLIDAAERGADLTPALNAIVHRFGFERSCTRSADHTPNRRMIPACTFSRPHRRMGHAVRSARLRRNRSSRQCSFESCLPLIWDQSTERGKAWEHRCVSRRRAAQQRGERRVVCIACSVACADAVLAQSRRPSWTSAGATRSRRISATWCCSGQYFQELFVKAFSRTGPGHRPHRARR